MNGGQAADTQSLTSTEDYSLADSGHGLSDDSDHHSRLASLTTFRPSWNAQPPPRSLSPRARVQTSAAAGASDDTGIYIVETAERRPLGGVGVGPWTTTVRPSYGNNLATGSVNSDKLSRYKKFSSWQPQTTRSAATGASPSSLTQLKGAFTGLPLGRTSGRGVERSLKKNNEESFAATTTKSNHQAGTSSSLPPVPPSDCRRTAASPRSTAAAQRRAAAAVEQNNLSPVASSTDANVSDIESSTSGSFLVLGPHGTSRLQSCVSEL